MSDLEVMRGEFEAWAKSEGLTLRDDTARGYKTEIQCAWMAWQASRACLCVELPDCIGSSGNESYMDGWNAALDACEDAVHSNGVGTK